MELLIYPLCVIQIILFYELMRELVLPKKQEEEHVCTKCDRE